MKDKKHIARIEKELKAAGMTLYGFMKLETDHLPEIIHKNEHIMGVVYGYLHKTLDSVMLVATDKRVLFVDCKPLFQKWDEISYDVVSGVQMSHIGLFAGVTLHTRIQDFSLRFVNHNCANNFVKYIEGIIERTSETNNNDNYVIDNSNKQVEIVKSTSNKTNETYNTEFLSPKELDDSAVLSTVDKSSKPHASVIHYFLDKEDNYYFLTKIDTKKAKNIKNNSNIALTVHRSNSLKVLYVFGNAIAVSSEEQKQHIFEQLITQKDYNEGKHIVPITKIYAGEYIIYKIAPTFIDYQDHSRHNW